MQVGVDGSSSQAREGESIRCDIKLRSLMANQKGGWLFRQQPHGGLGAEIVAVYLRNIDEERLVC